MIVHPESKRLVSAFNDGPLYSLSKGLYALQTITPGKYHFYIVTSLSTMQLPLSSLLLLGAFD